MFSWSLSTWCTVCIPDTLGCQRSQDFLSRYSQASVIKAWKGHSAGSSCPRSCAPPIHPSVLWYATHAHIGAAPDSATTAFTAVDMGPNAMTYIPNFVKIGWGSQKFFGNTYTDRQQSDYISLFLFVYKIEKQANKPIGRMLFHQRLSKRRNLCCSTGRLVHLGSKHWRSCHVMMALRREWWLPALVVIATVPACCCHSGKFILICLTMLIESAFRCNIYENLFMYDRPVTERVALCAIMEVCYSRLLRCQMCVPTCLG